MAELFELSAALKLETEAFEQSVRNAVEMANQMQVRLEVNTRSAAELTARIADGMTVVAQRVSELTGRIDSSMTDSSQHITDLTSSVEASATAAWSRITASIQQAIDQTNAFLSMKGTQQISLQTTVTRQEQVLSSLTPVVSTPEVAGKKVGVSLGSEIASALSGVSVIMDGRAVGELVASEVDRELGQMAQTRRYTG